MKPLKPKDYVQIIQPSHRYFMRKGKVVSRSITMARLLLNSGVSVTVRIDDLIKKRHLTLVKG